MGLFEIIVAGISLVSSLTNIFEGRQGRGSCSRDPQLSKSIERIKGRLAKVERKISPPPNRRNEKACLEAYNKLLKALKQSKHYSDELIFKRTDYGTWVLVRKRKKKTILRDPEGEYLSLVK